MRLDKAMLDLAAEQRSQVATWQLRELGATATEISRLRDSARWEVVNRQVLAVRGAVRDGLFHANTAVLCGGPGAALSHEPATALWGVAGFRLLPAVVSQVHDGARRRNTAAPVRDLVDVPERWITRLNGIRVVRPELAAYQMCGVLSPQRAERTYDRFLSMRLLSVRSSLACLHDLEERGRDGTVVYRRILKRRGPNYVAPASGIESRFKELAEEAGVRLRRQVNLGDEQFDGRVDFYADDVKVVFEVQSELYHWALSDQQADAARREKLQQDGFHVEEIWDTDVWTRPGNVVQRIRRAVRDAKSTSELHRTV